MQKGIGYFGVYVLGSDLCLADGKSFYATDVAFFLEYTGVEYNLYIQLEGNQIEIASLVYYAHERHGILLNELGLHRDFAQLWFHEIHKKITSILWA